MFNVYAVDFDTGSSDLFVPSIDCGDTCFDHKKYDPKASSTSHDLEKPFEIAYEGGADVKGDEYTDDVIFGGLTVRGAMSFFFFSFFSPTNRSHVHHRRRARRLALQPSIILASKLPISRPTA